MFTYLLTFYLHYIKQKDCTASEMIKQRVDRYFITVE